MQHNIHEYANNEWNAAIEENGMKMNAASCTDHNKQLLCSEFCTQIFFECKCSKYLVIMMISLF